MAWNIHFLQTGPLHNIQNIITGPIANKYTRTGALQKQIPIRMKDSFDLGRDGLTTTGITAETKQIVYPRANKKGI